MTAGSISGFCCIWISNYGPMTKSLQEALKREEKEPLQWTRECKQAFEALKIKLGRAPELVLPILDKPFTLYIHETLGVWGL